LRSFRVPFFCLLLTAFLPLAAQDGGEVPKELLDTALEITCDARVEGETAGQAAWSEHSTALTIPGKPVALKIDARNVRLIVTLTPYVKPDGETILIAQNQVWVTDEKKSVTYHSSIRTIPVPKGMKIILYPLGRTASGPGSLILEISIRPYGETAGAAVRADSR